jgi:long-chain acyl-CoA synthetase
LTEPRYLLTGATGFLGREVLVRLLARGAVLVTTRSREGEPPAAARARIEEMILRTGPGTACDRLTVAIADVTQPGLGLSAEGRAFLDGGPIQIVHGAAEVRFDLPYEVMERQNVGGTKNVLALAEQLHRDGRLVRLDHVSTTYVAGDRQDVALESDLDVGQTNKNDYERTKLVAEAEVRRAVERGLPVTVHRPSIIVGDSRTGRASSFKVLYWPMKIYARGRFRTLFGRRECTVDAVPVDFVADAMIHLLGRPEAAGRTFHLAAGVERQSTIGELVAMAEGVFEQKPVRYVDPDLYLKWIRPFLLPILKIVRPDVADKGGVFLPYLKHNPSFSTAEADAILAPAGIAPPKVVDYFGAILRYAKMSDFGKREFELPAGTASSDPQSSSER